MKKIFLILFLGLLCMASVSATTNSPNVLQTDQGAALAVFQDSASMQALPAQGSDFFVQTLVVATLTAGLSLLVFLRPPQDTPLPLYGLDYEVPDIKLTMDKETLSPILKSDRA